MESEELRSIETETEAKLKNENIEHIRALLENIDELTEENEFDIEEIKEQITIMDEYKDRTLSVLNSLFSGNYGSRYDI